ncbi:MAG: hypothetical protein ACREF4_01830 [Gammaproteobacteria bacterium]
MTAAHTDVAAWRRTLESMRRYVMRRSDGRAPSRVQDARPVRLRSVIDESRATPVQRVMLEVLTREGPMPACLFVNRVARRLYTDEVSRGAWAIEIGVFGSALFAADAAHELAAGEGHLWDIEPELPAPR